MPFLTAGVWELVMLLANLLSHPRCRLTQLRAQDRDTHVMRNK